MNRAALLAPAAGLLAGGFGGVTALVPAAQPCAAATYGAHVTLVVEHGDARVVGLCIGFDGSSITGEQILQASGLEYATESYGSLGDAVCQLDSEPASYGACLPAGGSYWVMVVSRSGGPWQTSNLGISSETFGNGDAEGFRYDPQSGPEPPPASPAGICARALAGGVPSPPPARPSSSAPAPARPLGPGGGAGSVASPAGSVAPQPPAPTPAPSSAPAVILPPGGTSVAVAGTRRTQAAPGPSASLLAACAAIGALAGLLVVRLVRRRRLRAP